MKHYKLMIPFYGWYYLLFSGKIDPKKFDPIKFNIGSALVGFYNGAFLMGLYFYLVKLNFI
jgi:hypothetical protein